MIQRIICYLTALPILGGIAWYCVQPGYGPLLTVIGGVITLLKTLDTLRHKPRLDHYKTPLIATPNRNDVCNQMSDALDLFWGRFADAFPGVRGVQRYSDPQDCINRLSIMLANPLVFGNLRPIWWWRGGSSNPISEFRHLGGRKVLIDGMELVIANIAAVNLSHPARHFVYIQTKADKSSGVDPGSRKRSKRMLDQFGYAYEEMAYFRDRYVSRAEYDDGVASINGVPVALDGNAEVRFRYLSPYNLIIAPNPSVVNNTLFSQKFEEVMNSILRGKASIEDLAQNVSRLPNR